MEFRTSKRDVVRIVEVISTKCKHHELTLFTPYRSTYVNFKKW